MKRLDPEKLENRLSSWIGYGNLSALFWFIGPEEGGETSLPEQILRINLDPVSDLAEFITALNQIESIHAPWMTSHPPLQNTWSKLIRIYLCASGMCGLDAPSIGTEAKQLTKKVRSYQRDNWGRRNGDILVSELMPLSSRDTSSWKYSELTNRDDLRTRRKYIETWMPRRKKLIAELIERYQPKIVVAYGKTYWRHYMKLVARSKFHEILNGFGKTNGKLILIPHPVARGVKNLDFERVGHWIKDNIF